MPPSLERMKSQFQVMIKQYTSRIYKLAVFIFLFPVVLEVTGYIFGGGKPSDYLYFWTVYQDNKQKLEKYYSINIDFYIEKNDYPSDWWKGEREEETFTTINDGYRRAQLLRFIPYELEKYPVDIIKNNIMNLYFFSVLSPNGAEVGGTYDEATNSLFLATSSKSNREYRSDFIKRAFHHEFSSILMDQFHFSELEWRSAAGEGFQYEQDKNPIYRWLYLNDYIERVYDNDAFWERGLIRQYGETGVENDFNVYAENIFVNPKKMKRLVAEYPIIKRKYEVFKEFYLSIDKGFAPVFSKIDE